MRFASRHVVPAMLIVVGVIHLLPLPGVLGGERLTALYGVAIEEPNLSLLLRHRAVLFGLLGSFMVWAALRPALHTVAWVAGVLSVVSFLVLAWMTGGVNLQVGRVVVADVVALGCLTVAGAALWVRRAATD